MYYIKDTNQSKMANSTDSKIDQRNEDSTSQPDESEVSCNDRILEPNHHSIQHHRHPHLSIQTPVSYEPAHSNVDILIRWHRIRNTDESEPANEKSLKK